MRFRFGAVLAVLAIAACDTKKTTPAPDTSAATESTTVTDTNGPVAVAAPMAARRSPPQPTTKNLPAQAPCISTNDIQKFQDSVAKLIAIIKAKKVDTVRVPGKTVTRVDTVRLPGRVDTVTKTVQLPARVDTLRVPVSSVTVHDTVAPVLADDDYFSLKPAQIFMYRTDTNPPQLMDDAHPTHIDSGQSITIRAMCVNKAGNPIPCPKDLEYKSSDTSIATVKKISWLHVPVPSSAPFLSHGVVPNENRIFEAAFPTVFDPRTVHYSSARVRAVA